MRRVACLFIACLAAAGPLGAQTGAGPVVQSYGRSFFAAFGPQTALDMVNRLPGFVLDAGTDLRGFGNATGNVLIDGEPPPSKSGGVTEALSRLPAAQVERIELLQGSAGRQGSAATVVANVVRRGAAFTGRWSASAGRRAGRPEQWGELGLTALLGDWQSSFGLSGYASRDRIGGTRTRLAADESLVLFETQDIGPTYRGLTLSGELARALGEGKLTLTARADVATVDQSIRRDGYGDVAAQGPLVQVQRFGIDSRTTTAEAGATWNGPLAAAWGLKLLTLGKTRATDDGTSGLRSAGGGQLLFANSSRLKDEALELIASATVGRTGDVAWRPELGVELAFNRLDSTLDGSETVPPGATVPLPTQSTRAQELRSEWFAKAAWTASPRFSADAGLALEFSTIRVTGGAGAERSLFFAKPGVGLTWRPVAGVELRGSLRRSVGQLDFNNFAASAELASERSQSGNPQLVPDRRTRASLALDLRGGKGAALNLEAFVDERRDVVDAVILGPGQGGIGNAGNATVRGLSASGTLPLGALATGLTLSANGLWQQSRFTDPATGQRRPLNDFQPRRLRAELRQDLPAHRLAWGMTLDGSEQVSNTFLNEITRTDDPARWGAFAETTALAGLKVRLEALNIVGYDVDRDRRFFSPDRSGVPAGRQALVFAYGPRMQLTVSGTF